MIFTVLPRRGQIEAKNMIEAPAGSQIRKFTEVLPTGEDRLVATLIIPPGAAAIADHIHVTWPTGLLEPGAPK